MLKRLSFNAILYFSFGIVLALVLLVGIYAFQQIRFAIKNYQYVVPSTWNLCPRCSEGKPGPVEEALIGTPVADPKKPLEILRTVHSFDPCIACGVHVIDPDSNQVYKIKVL